MSLSSHSKVEDASVNPGKDDNLYRPGVDTTGVDERKLIRRIDIRVVPWLGLLYLLNFLDRGAIGNAKLYNMEVDLHITDTQYLIALTVFFFPYALFEPVSNVVLRRFRPSIWLSSMMLVWGIVMVGQSFFHRLAWINMMRLDVPRLPRELWRSCE
ncbi:MFS general substrate transporter [Leucogyrophana mollusca]|uniref:MFS general substrate transporter n=1 Tax=Leucogyrophana mollusca TaxID=85980 RepID=A0ACB8AW77_9AGAM|nr:MFS general substrate transporter [Leucogyrophana mollusca]